MDGTENGSASAFFRAESRGESHVDGGGETLVPLPRARSGWGDAGSGQIRGTSISGVLARAAERVAETLDDAQRFRPVRWTLDMFRPAGMVPVTTEVTVVRQGRRLRLIDAELVADGRTVARGSVLLLATDGVAHGTAWAGVDRATPAPPTISPTTDEPTLYYSERVGWTGEPGPHRNAERKMIWYLPDPIVAGEEPTPFQHAATVSDTGNMVTNWGGDGIEFINADVTLALSRLPARTDAIGLIVEQRHVADGIAMGTATMFDRDGPLGTVLVSTLAFGHAVDPGGVPAAARTEAAEA